MNIQDEKEGLRRRKKQQQAKKKRQKVYITLSLLTVLFVVGGGGILLWQSIKETKPIGNVEMHVNKSVLAVVKKEVPERKIETITVSAAGDFTLGYDEDYGYTGSFVHEADTKGLEHFVGGLNDIFKNDDFSTVNLETTLTTSTQKAQKKFRFKGNPEYAKILTMAGIEAVNLANNHIYDYLEQGYQDTMANLEKENIGYFGYDRKYIDTINGIKVGALGYEGWSDTQEIRNQIEKDIQSLRNQGVQLTIVHFHWGIERQYVPTKAQQTLARFTIDSGADLVLGHHPHVVQGIEEYNDKFIVYSLGNFMFGGNKNPSDKDTFVFQQKFYFENGKLSNKKEIDIVPFSISSTTHRNDFRPTMLTGEEHDRVHAKIVDVSNQINGSSWLVYEVKGPIVSANE